MLQKWFSKYFWHILGFRVKAEAADPTHETNSTNKDVVTIGSRTRRLIWISKVFMANLLTYRPSNKLIWGRIRQVRRMMNRHVVKPNVQHVQVYLDTPYNARVSRKDRTEYDNFRACCNIPVPNLEFQAWTVDSAL